MDFDQNLIRSSAHWTQSLCRFTVRSFVVNYVGFEANKIKCKPICMSNIIILAQAVLQMFVFSQGRETGHNSVVTSPMEKKNQNHWSYIAHLSAEDMLN